MQIRSIRVIFVLVFVALACSLVYIRYFYLDERGRQATLTSDINCADVLPSDLEIQGKRTSVPADKACAVLKSIGALKTLAEAPDDTTNPWRYFGRFRIKLVQDVWMLAFRARKVDGYKLTMSVRHWKGSGWTIVGDFDADSTLRTLGVADRIDTVLLQSPDALIPTDQSQPM